MVVMVVVAVVVVVMVMAVVTNAIDQGGNEVVPAILQKTGSCMCEH